MKHLARTQHALRYILAAGFLLSGTAQAATTAELKVTGRITPPSCDLTLDGNGVLNFGDRSFNSLNVDGTKLVEKAIGIQVTCDGATRVGLHVVDNRAGHKLLKSALNANAWASSSTLITDDFIYGLGTVTSLNDTQVPIGGYMFGFKDADVMVNSAKGYVIYSSDKRAWKSEVPQRNYMSSNLTYSFVLGSPGGTNATPTPLTSMNGSLTVTPTINRATELPTTAAIPLDGSATISLVYL